MKKILYLLMALVLLVSSVFASVTYDSVPVLDVTLLNQDPDPVSPGDYVDLRFKVNNEGIALAENVVFELLPTYPFTLDPGESKIKELGDLPSTGNSVYSYRFFYRVRVDDLAVEGENKIKIRYKVGSSEWITESFDVNVQSVDATISIESVKTDPLEVKPGENAKLGIKIKNMADSMMKDVSLKLDLTFSSYIAQVTTTTISDSLSNFDSIPFAPIGSATEKKIKAIGAGEEVMFNFDLISYPDAQAGVYKIPVVITYYDELGEAYTKYDVIGVVVGANPDLSIVMENSDLVVGKTNGEISIKFINKGLTDVKFLDVIMKDSSDFELLSANEVYLGNIDSDDYETADFNILVTKEIDEKVTDEYELTIPLEIEYKDANNRDYNTNIELPLKVYSSKKLGESNGKSNAGLIIFVVVIIIGGFFYLRRKKRSKN